MICFKYKFDVPLDSIERTLAHQKILASKPFLRKIYLEWYKWLLAIPDYTKPKKYSK